MKSIIETKDHTGQRTNYWSAFLILLAISTILADKRPWSWFTSSGFLLFAWFQYYYSGPSLTKTPQQIYQTIRAGRRRIPLYAHAAGWLAVIMCTVGILGSLELL